MYSLCRVTGKCKMQVMLGLWLPYSAKEEAEEESVPRAVKAALGSAAVSPTMFTVSECPSLCKSSLTSATPNAHCPLWALPSPRTVYMNLFTCF